MNTLPIAKPLKITVALIWLLLALGILGWLLLNPGSLNANTLAGLLKQSGEYFLVLYIIVSFLRGFTLLPSTPFVLAGALLLPGNNHAVMLISMAGILLSSAIIYYMSGMLGFDAFFEKKFPQKIDFLRRKINQPKGVFFVMLWSFFPVVPTDLICYVAGTTKMHFGRFLLAVFIGELPIVMAYAWAGQSLFELMFQ